MIKRINKEDIKLIKDCDDLLYKLIIEDSKYDNNYKINIKLNSLKQDLDDDNNYIYVYIDNKVVGFIYAQISNSKMYKDKVGKILFLYVAEEYRNKKVASKLIECIKQDFMKEKVKYLDVNVFYENKIANKLYRKLGFDNYVSNLRCKIN